LHKGAVFMKIIHTSDWHIGSSLYGRKRYPEYEAFLEWLAQYIESQEVDALLVAGDIFDSKTPSNRAQELYYRFLCRVAGSSCRHVVICSGNHDSPSLLDAPAELLRFLNIHVVGCMTDPCSGEIKVLNDPNGEPELIACAVPYLRDRDIRQVDSGESVADKERKLLEGIRSHYQQVCDEEAQALRSTFNRPVPLVVMGHLFTAGGQSLSGDGVRDLYIGTLAHVNADIFPPAIDYLALGHLHLPQKVGGADNRRYSGSPLPMGFGEATQTKCINLVEFSGTRTKVTEVAVPLFQPLESISGDWEIILTRLNELKCASSRAWLEIVYEGREVIGNLRDLVEEATAGTDLNC
jgi:exonuclease SbcD